MWFQTIASGVRAFVRSGHAWNSGPIPTPSGESSAALFRIPMRRKRVAHDLAPLRRHTRAINPYTVSPGKGIGRLTMRHSLQAPQ